MVIKEIIKLSISRLEESINTEEKIFCNRFIIDKNNNLIRSGKSLRYSIFSLIGLYKAYTFGYKTTINIDEIVKTIYDSNQLDIIDNSHFLWLLGLIHDKKLIEKRIERVLKIENEIFKYGNVDIAWVLTSLCSIYPITNNQKDLYNLIQILKKRLVFDFDQNGELFCKNRHNAANKIVQRINNTIGSFANQVYSIYALSKYLSLFKDSEVKDIIQRCAKNICELQGDSGQWWWIYNTQKGCIAEKYPVYAVHQDGMAPMALFKLAEVTNTDYSQYILKGLGWFNNNELGKELINYEKNFIYRSILRKKGIINPRFLGIGYGGLNISGRLNIANSALLGSSANVQIIDQNKLEIDLETRPYHYGWILEGFVGRENIK